MSTKTLRKRIALVAVSALGFGLVSAAPSSAAAINLTSTAVATTTPVSTTAATPSAVGTAITATVNLVQAAVADAAHTIGATYTLTDPNGTNVTSSATFTSAPAAVGGVTPSNTANVYAFAVAIASTAATKAIGTVSFIPTTAGAYVLTYTTANTTLANGDTNTVITNGVAGRFFVSGTGAVVAASGIGTTTIGAVAGGIAKVRFGTDAHTTGAVYNVTSSGVGSIQTIEAGTFDDVDARVGIAAASDFTQGARLVTDADADFNDAIIVVNSAVSGTQTLSFTRIDSATGAPAVVATQVITWGASPAVSTQYSAVRISAGTTGNGTAVSSATASDATVATTVSSATGTQRFVIRAGTFDQNNAAISVASFGASISGPGLLSITNTNTNTNAGNGRSVSTAAASNTATVAVWGDGSAGAATITITATTAAGATVTLGTKTVTFVGAPASVTVTQNLFIARAGLALGLPTATTSRVAATANSIATTPAIRASVLDAGGNPVAAGSVVRIISSDESVIVPGACAEYTTTGSTTAQVPAPGRFECVVSGANAAASGSKATITFQVQNAATGLWSISATPITFAIGGTIASVELATDKATYAPGEAMVMTATAKDSAGNLAADGLTPYASISTNMTVTGAPAATAIITNGVHTTNTSTGVKTMFAPSSVGNLVVSGLTTNATTGTAYSVALKIENADLDSALAAAADAAAEATDAANAATDAANAAAEAADAATAAAQDAADAVAALSTSVTAMVDSLRKQITSLTNLVIKIQRKVRA
jgi:trimeric autotransporter adhesin